MSTQKEMLKKRRVLLGELHSLANIVVGSFFAREMQGSERYCLSRMKDGKQRQVYVSEQNKDAVQMGVEQYQRALMILRELGEVNLKLIQRGVDLSNV